MQLAAPLARPVRRFLPAGAARPRPVLIALIVLAIAVGVGFVAYQRIAAQSAPPPVGQIVPVQRGNVAATVSATGSVTATKQAKLVFSNSGRIKDIMVNVGDQVSAGQPLAHLVSDTNELKLETAKSQLATAKLKLQQLTETATPEDVAAAQASYAAAMAKLNDLQAGPTTADMQAARSAVVQAQSALTEANAKLQTLIGGPTATDRATAQANLVSTQNALAAAQAKLDQLQSGPTNLDTITAQNSVADARGALKVAQAKLDQLQAGSTEADLSAAQASFDKAQADVTNTKVKLEQVKATASFSSDIVQAQATLAAAESKVHAAHQDLDQLTAQLEQANADLAGQQSSLASSIKSADQTCGKLGASSAECASARSKTDAMQSTILKARQQVKLLSGNGSWDQIAAQKSVAAAQAAYDSAATALKQTLANHNMGVDLIAAQTAYDTSLSSVTSARAKLDQTRAGATNAELQSAQAAVDQAKSTLANAQAKLDQIMAGATDADSVAASTAVETAQANVDSAQAKFDNLAVPTAQDIAASRSAQTSAAAALETAQAKLAQLQAGPTQGDLEAARSGVAAAAASLATKSGNVRQSDVALQQEAVRLAELSVQQAQLDFDNNTLLAPFDGIVASISGNPGENAPSGTSGFMTLVDPREVRVDVTVDETDVAKLAVGKTATISFDALPGRTFRGQVISVAPSGTVTQGVVNYPVALSIDARNQALPAGMTASTSIIIDEKNDVLVVPPRAVRRSGREQVVDLVGPEGKPVQQVVKTGVQNDQSVEIVDGLHEGDQVMISGTTTRAPNPGPAGPVPGGRVVVGR